MSQSVILACPSACDLATLATALERTARNIRATFQRGEGEIQLVGPHRRFYIAVSEMHDQDAVALEYEANEDLDVQFRAEVLGLRFFLLRFNDWNVAKRTLLDVLEELASRGMNPWMDTDYGWVIRGADAAIRLRKDPEWDWRHPAPDDPTGKAS